MPDDLKPKTLKELLAIISHACKEPETLWKKAQEAHPDNPYGTDESGAAYNAAADALWKCAVAAFEYAVHRVQPSGFQASYAALNFYAKAMYVNGPFMVVKAEDALYPQYNLPGKVNEWLHSKDMRKWLAEEAQKLLDQNSEFASPTVVAHWHALIQQGGEDA